MSDETTHEDLLQAWGERYPREKLGKDGEATLWGRKALREIKQFTVAEVEAAMHREKQRDGPKQIEHVIAYLKQHNFTLGETHWLDKVQDGTVVSYRSHTGIVVGGYVWIERKTPTYETPYFCMVSPSSLQTRWNFLDPIKAGGWKDEIRERIKKGYFDGGCPNRHFADAMRLDKAFVDTPQTKRAKPDTPTSREPHPKFKKMKSSLPVGDLIDELVSDASVPKSATTVTELSTDEAEAAAINADYMGSDEPDPEVLF